MSLTFRSATHLAPQGEGTFATTVPDGWQQGKGAFGGLALGYLVRAACAVEDDPARRMRTFSADIAAPVMPGPATVRARVLRRGRSQTNLQLELEQAGEVLVSGIATLSGPRPVAAPERQPSTPADATRRWQEVSPTPLGPKGPVFAQHYEYRNLGALPFLGASEPVTAGFVRERAGEGELDAAAITALLDAYFPAIFIVATRPMMTTTVSFSSQYVALDTPLAADEPLYFRARMETQRDGYFVEFRELWHQERLIALNQQTFAVLG